MTIDFDNHYKTMKKVPANTNYAGVTDLAKPKAAVPEPKTGVVGAASQVIKQGHDKDGKLLNHVAPAGETKDLASAMFPSMCVPYEIKTPEGYSHLVPNAKQQQEFLALARSFGLNQQQVNQLVLVHCKCFDPVQK
jgi:hypothetical protein